jgi:hypothetical protein
MSATIRVFVDERPVEVEAGSTVRDALLAHDESLAEALEDTGTYVTDGVGRKVDAGSELVAGSILRVVRSARRPAGDEPSGGVADGSQ